ncbi:MAG TPA: GFA family protein [Allosphingosinicella sp.]|nr:GFA family protein [Allosphingosinicella sp.]
MGFQGSCHCGRLAYTVDEEPPARAMLCNCSICRRKGALHHFTTPDRFKRKASDEDIGVYTFNAHNIRHQFCKTCGCAPFAEGTGPDGRAMVEINLRCAEGIDPGALEITEFDGASL